MQRIVVEHQQPLGLDATSEGECVGEPGMPPADVVRVLLVGVLAVVDQEVGVLGEVVSGDPLRLERLERGTEPGLVVGDVGEGGRAVGDPVSECRASVGDGLSADTSGAQIPLAGGRVEEVDLAGQLTDLDGGERGRDVARNALLEGGLRRRGPPDRDLGLRSEAGCEEHQALDVVQVQVGEEDVDLGQPLGDADAEAADAGACVDDQGRAVRQLELDTGGIAAVAVHLGSRRGDRTARSPYLQLHRYLTISSFLTLAQPIAV